MNEELNEAQNKAEELGVLIEQTEIFKHFRDLHQELIQDDEAKGLLKEHQEAFLKIHDLEREGKPVETEDKHALQDAQEKLHQNTALQEYAAAQADFQQLMNRVTSGIYSHIQLDPLFEDTEEEED